MHGGVFPFYHVCHASSLQLFLLLVLCLQSPVPSLCGSALVDETVLHDRRYLPFSRKITSSVVEMVQLLKVVLAKNCPGL